MTEPSAIWSMRKIVFDQSISVTQNVIISHGLFALQSMVQKIEYLVNLTKINDDQAAVFGNPEMLPMIDDIIFQQGIISTILFNDSPKTTRETSSEYKLRTLRMSYVNSVLSNKRFDTINNKKVRNSICHIDEYLARALKKEKTGWFVDQIWTHRDLFNAPDDIEINYIRCFIANEGMIVHLGNEISIEKLREEALEILQCFNIAPLSGTQI